MAKKKNNKTSKKVKGYANGGYIKDPSGNPVWTDQISPENQHLVLNPQEIEQAGLTQEYATRMQEQGQPTQGDRIKGNVAGALAGSLLGPLGMIGGSIYGNQKGLTGIVDRAKKPFKKGKEILDDRKEKNKEELEPKKLNDIEGSVALAQQSEDMFLKRKEDAPIEDADGDGIPDGEEGLGGHSGKDSSTNKMISDVVSQIPALAQFQQAVGAGQSAIAGDGTNRTRQALADSLTPHKTWANQYDKLRSGNAKTGDYIDAIGSVLSHGTPLAAFQKSFRDNKDKPQGPTGPPQRLKDGGKVNGDNMKKGYKKGGLVEGAGTSKSDSIKAKVDDGSFVVPAENVDRFLKENPEAKKLGKADLKKGDTDVKLSDDEFIVPSGLVAKLEKKGVDLDKYAPNAEGGNELKHGGNVGYETLPKKSSEMTDKDWDEWALKNENRLKEMQKSGKLDADEAKAIKDNLKSIHEFRYRSSKNADKEIVSKVKKEASETSDKIRSNPALADNAQETINNLVPDYKKTKIERPSLFDILNNPEYAGVKDGEVSATAPAGTDIAIAREYAEGDNASQMTETSAEGTDQEIKDAKVALARKLAAGDNASKSVDVSAEPTEQELADAIAASQRAKSSKQKAKDEKKAATKVANTNTANSTTDKTKAEQQEEANKVMDTALGKSDRQTEFDNTLPLLDAVDPGMEVMATEKEFDRGQRKAAKKAKKAERKANRGNDGGGTNATAITNAAVSAAVTGLGIYQTIQANKSAREMGEEPTINVSPELQSTFNRISDESSYGIDSAERTALENQISQQQRGSFEQIEETGAGRGSQMASKLLTTLKGNKAAENIAVGSAGVQRQKLAMLPGVANMIQNVHTRADLEKLKSFRLKEEAIGAMGSTGLENIVEGGKYYAGAREREKRLDYLSRGISSDELGLG